MLSPSVSRARRVIVGASALFAFATLPVSNAEASVFLPNFDEATFIPGDTIDNTYFPMTWTETRSFIGEALRGPDVDEGFELSNIGPGRIILGVQTQTQFDQAFEDGLLVEETRDYFAQDSDGNVWYFGEDVTNFIYDDDGNLIGTNNESAWIAGENGALPGFIMPADIEVGFNYFQEFAPNDEALDQGTIFATGLTLETELGVFTDVIQILETTELDRKAIAFKYFAPGFGLILEEEGLNRNFKNPRLAVRIVGDETATLTADFDTARVAVPEPATWMMMFLGFGAIGAFLRRRRVALAC